MIVSFIEGRVRIRHKALKDADKMNSVTGLLSAYPGIKDFSANQQTGSLLVNYDPAQISQNDLALAAKMLQDNLAPGESAKPAEKACTYMLSRKQKNMLLAASLGFCMLGAFTSRRAHMLAASGFALLTMEHVYRRR